MVLWPPEKVSKLMQLIGENIAMMGLGSSPNLEALRTSVRPSSLCCRVFTHLPLVHDPVLKRCQDRAWWNFPFRYVPQWQCKLYCSIPNRNAWHSKWTGSIMSNCQLCFPLRWSISTLYLWNQILTAESGKSPQLHWGVSAHQLDAISIQTCNAVKTNKSCCAVPASSVKNRLALA